MVLSFRLAEAEIEDQPFGQNDAGGNGQVRKTDQKTSEVHDAGTPLWCFDGYQHALGVRTEQTQNVTGG